MRDIKVLESFKKHTENAGMKVVEKDGKIVVARKKKK